MSNVYCTTLRHVGGEIFASMTMSHNITQLTQQCPEHDIATHKEGIIWGAVTTATHRKQGHWMTARWTQLGLQHNISGHSLARGSHQLTCVVDAARLYPQLAQPAIHPTKGAPPLNSGVHLGNTPTPHPSLTLLFSSSVLGTFTYLPQSVQYIIGDSWLLFRITHRFFSLYDIFIGQISKVTPHPISSSQPNCWLLYKWLQRTSHQTTYQVSTANSAADTFLQPTNATDASAAVSRLVWMLLLPFSPFSLTMLGHTRAGCCPSSVSDFSHPTVYSASGFGVGLHQIHFWPHYIAPQCYSQNQYH